jgi:hypothetical protein
MGVKTGTSSAPEETGIWHVTEQIGKQLFQIRERTGRYVSAVAHQSPLVKCGNSFQ